MLECCILSKVCPVNHSLCTFFSTKRLQGLKKDKIYTGKRTTTQRPERSSNSFPLLWLAAPFCHLTLVMDATQELDQISVYIHLDLFIKLLQFVFGIIKKDNART